MALKFVRSPLYAFVAVLPGMTALSAGAEPRREGTPESGQPRAVDAKSLVVKMQSGADSPRAAVSAFVAASNAGDVEAVLLLIDPQVRPLIKAESLLEEYLLERHLLRNSLMTAQERMSPSNNLGAFPVVYARRDLARTIQIDVLKERQSTFANDRVLLDVDWKLRSWDASDQEHPFDVITVTLLAVRRDGRWYLFHPFGSIYAALLYSDEHVDEAAGPEESQRQGGKPPAVLRSERRNQPDVETYGIACSVEYRVPIEVVHEALVDAAQTSEATELFKQALELVRFENALRNQAIRGDFHDLADLDRASAAGDSVSQSLVDRYSRLLQTAVNGLARKPPKKPCVSSNPAAFGSEGCYCVRWVARPPFRRLGCPATR